MAVNLRGLDKYGSKHTGSQTNIQAKIGGTNDRIRTDGVYIREGTVRVYIQEGKDMRTLHSNDQTYPWYELISHKNGPYNDGIKQNICHMLINQRCHHSLQLFQILQQISRNR